MSADARAADALLLLAACIWGTAFVAQRAGMEHVGPMTFTAVRFALGTLALLPFALRLHRRARREVSSSRWLRAGGALAGLVLFLGVSFQQVGLVYTTAGKAGFITGLYVVIVPFLGLFVGQRVGLGGWLGAVLAAGGLYLLSVAEGLSLARGDALVLTGAVFWALHILVLGWLSPRMEPVVLACAQFGVCSLLSAVVALCTERMDFSSLASAAVPILYGGVLSVGVGYTLQVAGQRRAPPAHAAIILSLEAVFAVLGGWVVLGEELGCRALVGCGLMFAAILLSQLTRPRRSRSPAGQVAGESPQRDS